MVDHRFLLGEETERLLRALKPVFGFGGFAEATYYRTYSRTKEDGSRERWNDTVIRVINGVLSIRKSHLLRKRRKWDETYWQEYGREMALAMFEMRWLPPGRGLWAMGTEHVYRNGGAALHNCGAVDTADLTRSAEWCMDMLMCGVGVGFNTAWGGDARKPDKSSPLPHAIADSREGWVESLRLLIESYTGQTPWRAFDYSLIRPAGSPIRGFGGTASGPEPLRKLHGRVERFLDDFCDGKSDTTRCVADIFNAIGACVVAGNVRRSAEIALGSIKDATFLDLKNYDLHPERASIGWVSNNTVILEEPDDFDKLPLIAGRIRANGEPGVMNLVNVRRFGRYGEERPDRAWLANPCGEIPLESFELCNLSEVFPTKCPDERSFDEALGFATLYASTVALLPTHREETNAVIEQNRRIGVSLSGVAEWRDSVGEEEMVRRLRRGYGIVRTLNRHLAREAGVPESIRVTTIKPSGTLSLLAGVSGGIRFPLFEHAIRRIRVGNDTPVCTLLKEAGVPWESDRNTGTATVFEFPIRQHARKGGRVSAEEQFALLALMQREWSDNMVSCTVSFDPATEGEGIADLLRRFLPYIKGVSLFPDTAGGAYPQMPLERISAEEYETRLRAIAPIDWSSFAASTGERDRYCTAEQCAIAKFESTELIRK